MNIEEVGSKDPFFEQPLQNLEEITNRISNALGYAGMALVLRKSMEELDGTEDEESTSQYYYAIEHNMLQIAKAANYILKCLGYQVDTNSEQQISSVPSELDSQPLASTKKQTSTLSQLEPAEIPKEQKNKESEIVEKYTGQYYERIITPDEVPIIENTSDEESIYITITSDKTIMINEDTIYLDGHELFTFNALMLLRDKERTAKEIRKLGFQYTEKRLNLDAIAFRKSLMELAKKLYEATDERMIYGKGEKSKKQYLINPNITLIEGRNLDVKKN